MHIRGNHWQVPSCRVCLSPLYSGQFPLVTATVTNVEGAAAETQFLSIKTSAIMCHVLISNAKVI